MNRSCKGALLLLALLGTTLPSPAFAQAQAVETKAFLASPGESIKTIGLVTIDEPWGYFLGEGGVSSFGIAGLLASTFKRPKHPEYERAGFRFSDVADSVLTEHLKAAGFDVVSVPVKRKKSFQLLRDYKPLSAPNVDAYLDVVSGGVGYRQNDSAPDFAQKVGPYVAISVQLVSARSKEILYADTIEYSWRKAHRKGLPGSEINAPDEQIFADAESVKMDLLGGQGSRSLTQLTQGIDIAMRKIVSEFSAYPETGSTLQVGAAHGTGSPTEVAKAAPAEVAITGWRQKPITDFQAIAGEWEGFVLTAKRKKFDLEITFRQDGSYTFRANRGTTRTASAMHIADGVVKGKSYMTGDPVTITLYEDEDGNHVLKAYRADGLTWTVAKTEYALSSFLTAGGAKVKPAPMAPAATTTKPRPDAAPSTTVAKAAPATPLPGAALTGWRQKPITNFQIIVGKWEGFVLTPKGKKYDYEVTYGDDGTYAFRVERGMLRSGGGNRIAGGVIKSKSYVTGNPMTIALYEDERGNHVLQAQGADGHTSTVAKAEYALSSFLAAGGAKVKPTAMAPSAGTTPRTAPTAAPSTVAKAAPRVAPSQQTRPSAQLREQTDTTQPNAAPPPTTVAKATPETQQAAVFRPYRIGIFPAAGEFAPTPGSPWGEEYAAQIFGKQIKADASSLRLEYSYYDPELNEPRIYDYTKVWAGSKPKLSAIYREAETRHLDAVFLYRGTGVDSFIGLSYRVPSGPMPIELYLIDVKQQRTHAQKGDTSRLEKMMDELISRLLQGQAR